MGRSSPDQRWQVLHPGHRPPHWGLNTVTPGPGTMGSGHGENHWPHGLHPGRGDQLQRPTPRAPEGHCEAEGVTVALGPAPGPPAPPRGGCSRLQGPQRWRAQGPSTGGGLSPNTTPGWKGRGGPCAAPSSTGVLPLSPQGPPGQDGMNTASTCPGSQEWPRGGPQCHWQAGCDRPRSLLVTADTGCPGPVPSSGQFCSWSQFRPVPRGRA